MDYFGRENLSELIEQKQAPAISIYLPIERQNLKKKSTRLSFRNLVDEAVQLLKDDSQYEAQDYQPMIDRLMGHVENSMFWNYLPDGIAVFISPQFERIYRLPYKFEPQVVVGDNFHTRPLSKYLLAPDRFWLLSIGQKHVQLWEGNQARLTAVELDELPDNLEQALFLQADKSQDPVNFHSSGGHNMGKERHSMNTSRGGPAPMYHGHGGGRDEQKAYLREFFSKIDRVVSTYLKGEDGPVILAAVDYHHPIYKSVSQLKQLVPEGIHGNVSHWNEAELHKKAWDIAKLGVDQKIKDTLQLWERSYGMGKGEMEISSIAKRILESRVRTLLIEDNRAIWGQLDRTTGTVEFIQVDANEKLNGHDPSAQALDILDELAEFVISHGGNVVSIPAELMPASTGVAAILR